MHARCCLRALSALLSLAALALPAAAQVLDNFSDGASLLEVPSMTPDADGWLRSDIAASVPGGSRSLALRDAPGSTALAFIESRASDGLQGDRLPTQTLLVSLGFVVTENAVGASAAGFGLRSLSAVPETGTWALAAMGLAVLARRVARHRPCVL